VHRTLSVPMLVMLFACTPRGAVALCEERAGLRCELAFACCSPEERGVAAGLYITSEDECVARTTALCRATGGAVDDSIALGRTDFDDVRAEECLAQLRAASEGCDLAAAQRAELLVCDDVTSGAVEGGGDCAFSSECLAGGTCDLEEPPEVDDALHAPLGACVAPPSQGDECPEGVCATGLFCQNNRCDALPGEGDACNIECAPGLYCAATDFVCAAQKADGDACVSTAECLSGVCNFAPDDQETQRCGAVSPGLCQ
jgi:hypothetical protein